MSTENEESAQTKGLTGLMVTVIQSPSSGLAIVELAAEVIAENARYNRWAYERKSRSNTSEMWNISTLASRSYAECSSAWNIFVSSSDREAKLEQFLSALAATREALKSARENDFVELDDPSMPSELREWL